MRRLAACLLAPRLFACLLGCLGSHRAPPDVAAATEPPAARDARMGWWREARFGLFIHWGLYAIPAGEWGDRKDHGEWIRDTAQIPIDEYDQLVARFNPVQFDADEWVRTAKDAGMKYIVITSKHHDGFCLFDSQYTDFDVMATPLARDILRELSAACCREGLRLCFYHSIMDWHHPDYLPRRKWEARPAERANFDHYVAHLKNQVRELVTNYGPLGVLWFDGEWEPTWTHERGLDLYRYVRALQPSIIINNRVDVGRGGMAGMTRAARFAGDFGTPEQEVPATGFPGVDWESCVTMNDHWGYNRNDANWKSSTDLIRMLVDTASKGGNLLLNVGPTAEGVFPEPCRERLREMGRWLRVNGEAVYDTHAGPFKPLPWGRCTQRRLDGGATRLYLHVFDWPQSGALAVPGLLSDPQRAYLLASGAQQPCAVSRAGDAIVVTLPATAPDSAATVIVLDVVGTPDIAEPPTIVADSGIFVDTLPVTISSSQKNVELRYTLDGTEPGTDSPVTDGGVHLRARATIRARAFRAAQPVSPAAQATFTQVKPRPAETIAHAAPGLRYEYYEGDWDKLPDFDLLVPAGTGILPDFNFVPRHQDEHFAFRYRGYVRVPRTGVYRFFTMSDDGSRLYIGDELVVDNDGLHGLGETAGVVALEAGFHTLTVTYFEKTGDDGLEVSFYGPGLEKQRVLATALFH